MLNHDLLRVASAFALTSILTGVGLAQDKKPADKHDEKPAAKHDEPKPPAPKDDKGGKPGEMSPEDKAMMAEMEKAGAPNENHKLLERFVGNWDTTVKMWMGPGEPEVSKGVARTKAIMGGRFVQEEYEGMFMGKPFAGLGLTGYDNQKGKFIGSWVDTLGTGMMTSTGAYDAASKTFTFVAEMTDPAAPEKTMKVKEVVKIVDDNKHTFEMWEEHDGKPSMAMEITYTRKK